MRGRPLLVLAFLALFFAALFLLLNALPGADLGDVIVGAMLAAVGFMLLWLLVNGVQRVDEGELAVILRLGRYGGARGPGLIWVTPGMEQIARYIPVSIQTQPFIAEPVFARDRLPLRVYLTTWYRFDPRVADADEGMLALRFSEEQWRQSIRGEVEAVVRGVMGKFDGMGLLNDAKSRESTEDQMTLQLRDRLRRRGVLLHQRRGVVLGGVDVEQGLKKALVDMTRIGIDAETRKKLLDTIFKDYPGLSPGIVQQLIASISGMEWRQVEMRMPALAEALVERPKPPETEPKPPEQPPRISREAWRRAIREVKDIDFDVKAIV